MDIYSIRLHRFCQLVFLLWWGHFCPRFFVFMTKFPAYTAVFPAVNSSAWQSGKLLFNAHAIRRAGSWPADHIAVWNKSHSTKALTNLLPTGGVMTPPYETTSNNLRIKRICGRASGALFTLTEKTPNKTWKLALIFIANLFQMGYNTALYAYRPTQ